MTHRICASVGTLWVLIGVFFFAQPASAAEPLEKRLELCFGCHGPTGTSQMPEIPSLGAQTAPYALIQLYMFRGKLRMNEAMNEAVKDFTDDDLRTFSDAIAKLPPPVPAEPADPQRMANGQALSTRYKCDFCHNLNLEGRDNVPRIAGQREDFLLKTLREYKANTRTGYDASMADVLAPITDAELIELSYYAARKR